MTDKHSKRPKDTPNLPSQGTSSKNNTTPAAFADALFRSEDRAVSQARHDIQDR